MTSIPGGCSISIDIPYEVTSTTDFWLGIIFGCRVNRSSYSETMIRIRNGIDASVAGGSFLERVWVDVCTISQTNIIGDVLESYCIPIRVSDISNILKIVAHNEYISIYYNETWMWTFSFESAIWATQPSMYLLYSSSVAGNVMEDVSRVELFAWREAVYIEMEQTGSQALGSVIQERPIEIVPLYDGSLSFSYNATKDIIEISGDVIYEHSITKQDISEAASDIIVRYSEVAAIRSSRYEEEEGFTTRIYRLSNLDMDAVQAAKTLVEKAFDRQISHSIRMRPDPRIEVGDILIVSYTASGTETLTEFGLVVESVSLRVRDAQTEMIISGRNSSSRRIYGDAIGLSINASVRIYTSAIGLNITGK